MKYSAYTLRLAITLFIGVFFFPACSNITSRIPEKPGDLKVLSEAGELVSYLKNQNLHLKTFKGIGRITTGQTPYCTPKRFGTACGKLCI